MPKIPTYQGSDTLSGSFSQPGTVQSEQLTSALNETARTLESFATRADKLEANRARLEFTKRLSEEQQKLQDEWEPDSGDDFITKARERYEQIADEYISNASNSRSRGFMTDRFGDIQATFSLQDQKHAYRMQSLEAGRQYGEAYNEYANAAYTGTRPDVFDGELEEMAKDLQISHNLAEEIKAKGRPVVWESWFSGRIERASTADEFHSIQKDLLSGKYNDDLKAPAMDRLNRRLDAEIKTLKAKVVKSGTQALDDALLLLQSGGDTDVLISDDEMKAIIDRVSAQEDTELLVRQMEIKRSIINDSKSYAGMGKQELTAEVTRLTRDTSHLNVGGDQAQTADAIRAHGTRLEIASAYLKAWETDPHGMLLRQEGITPAPLDISNVKAGLPERRALRDRLMNEEGILTAGLWLPEDKALFASIWNQQDFALRQGLYESLHSAVALGTEEGNLALWSAGMAATGGDPIMAGAFLSPDRTVLGKMTNGVQNAKLLKSAGKWDDLKGFARNSVLPAFVSVIPEQKENIATALTTYAAGILQVDERGEFSRDDAVEAFSEAEKALLGTRVEVRGRTMYVPHRMDGTLIPARDVREALFSASNETFMQATGGMYDRDGVLIDNPAKAFRNAGTFILRQRGLQMRLDLANEYSGLVYDADGRPLVFDMQKLIDTHRSNEQIRLESSTDLTAAERRGY